MSNAKFVAREGDIGWGFFSFDEDRKAHECHVAHPVLVLEEKAYGCIVAYGTSKVTSAPLETEWVLTAEESKILGLPPKPGMFILTRREMTTKHLNDRQAWAWVGGSHPIKGNVSKFPPECLRRLYKACKAAGLV